MLFALCGIGWGSYWTKAERDGTALGHLDRRVRS
jgi:hypothetical protein